MNDGHDFTKGLRTTICMLDVIFGQVSTFLKDSAAFVYGLGGF